MSAKNELTLTRVVAAPRALVFEVWTQPEHLARWWGPEGFTLPECRVELRAGGAFRFVMRGPDGSAYPFAGTFTEVEPPTRLVFVGLIHEGLEAITTVTFEELDAEQTRVTVHQRHSGESEATRGAPIGWGQSLDKLERYLRTATRSGSPRT